MTAQPDIAQLLDSLTPRLQDKRLAASPMLRGASPGEYLRPFMPSSPHTGSFMREGSMDRYYALASANGNILHGPLTEDHLRIINVMHAEKRLRHHEYMGLPQDTLLTVIMPTKNRTDALEGAILSVMAQTYTNWELLVIDDGGEERAEEAALRFNDARIRYFRLDESVGASQTRNIALENAKGEYISYLDDDDQWDPDFLLISYGDLLKYKRRFTYSAQMVWRDFDPDTNLGKQFLLLRYTPFNRGYIENNNFISMISCMHHKSLYEEMGGFDISLRTGVDWEFFLRLTEAADPMQTPCILSHYYMFRYQQNVTTKQGPLLMIYRAQALLQSRSVWRRKLKIGTSGKTFDVFSISKKYLERREATCMAPPVERLTVIITGTNNMPNLERCLNSISDHTPHVSDVYVIDDAAAQQELSPASALQRNFPPLRTVTGLREALQDSVGASPSSNAYVALVNPNTLLTPRWLEELLFLFARFPDAGMAVPRCVLPPRNASLPNLVPHMFYSFEADIALHGDYILRPNIDYEGYFELSALQGFSVLLLPAYVLGEVCDVFQNSINEDTRQELCRAIREKTAKKIYYTPFSKAYFIPSSTIEIE